MRLSFRLLTAIIILYNSVCVMPKRHKEHYHSYMLSDYKRQHNLNTQRDYIPHKPPVNDIKGRTDKHSTDTRGPLIMLNDGEKKVFLEDLLVRIYKNFKFYCMGTLMTELLIMTAATCFMNMEPGDLTIKTKSSQDFLDVIISKSNTSFLTTQRSLITILALKSPIDPNAGNFLTKLCDVSLGMRTKVELPTYIRWRSSIHTQITEIIPLDECRTRMNDPSGNVVTDTMICVGNKRGSDKCQPTQGNPLVHNGRICGINMMGHNCPQPYGVDIYASVYSADDYVKNRFNVIRKSKLEQAIIFIKFFDMPTFYILLFLTLVCHDQIVLSYNHYGNSTKKKGHRRVHKLRYQIGDWYPHFGYHPSHMASDHVSHVSKHKQKLIPDLGIPLDHYVVRLMDNENHFCSGIIVNQQQILTTSLCLVTVPFNEILVKIYDGSTYNIIDKTNGKGFAVDAGMELLTLLTLGSQLNNYFKMAPSICSHRLPIGEMVQLWSWNSRMTNLKKINVTQMNDEKCQIAINDPKKLVLNNSTSCVENNLSTGTCQLNMGLPYIYKKRFCGLNLLGHNCPNISSADVYIRLLDEKRYISERMNLIRKFRLDDDIF